MRPTTHIPPHSPLPAALFSRPMPGLSARLNALATQLTCEWLMGPLAVNDVVVDSGEVGKGHGLLVQRCR